MNELRTCGMEGSQPEELEDGEGSCRKKTSKQIYRNVNGLEKAANKYIKFDNTRKR